MNQNVQFSQILKENEQLILELEKYRNENNILKIKISEMKSNINKLTADLKLEESFQREIKNQSMILKETLNETKSKIEEISDNLKNKNEEIKSIEIKANCKMSEILHMVQTGEKKNEEIEIFKREIIFLKNLKYRINEKHISETRTQSVLAEFYKSLNLVEEINKAKLEDTSMPVSSLNCNKNSILMQKLMVYEEELTKERKRKSEEICLVGEYAKKLQNSKLTIEILSKEIEIFKQHSKLSESKQRRFDFKKGLQNLEKFDQDLRNVYTNCIDLFVSLDKSILIKMEKSLNDCVIEFKEIREMLLNKI